MSKCSYCDKEIPEDELQAHELKCACSYGDNNVDFSNMIPCEICNELINFSEYEEHIKTCGITTRNNRRRNYLRLFNQIDNLGSSRNQTNQNIGNVTILNELNHIFTNLPQSNIININPPVVNATIVNPDSEEAEEITNEGGEINTEGQEINTQNQNDNINEVLPSHNSGDDDNHESIEEDIDNRDPGDSTDDDMPELVNEYNEPIQENITINQTDSIFNLINSYYSNISTA